MKKEYKVLLYKRLICKKNGDVRFESQSQLKKLMYIVHSQWWYTILPILHITILDTQLNEPTIQNLNEVPTVVEPTNKKRYYKTLGTSAIKAQCPLPPCFQYVYVSGQL